MLRAKRFDALSARGAGRAVSADGRLVLATPLRRTRRAQRHRRGDSIDLRRTLRGSLRTGGDPIRLARRRRRVVPRRLVLLCDISGSMEPYARAYLQFLTCAAGRAGAARAEAFVFATRLTRLTRALHSRNPERAIQRAAATAPDWSSGTRIGDALKTLQRSPRPARDGTRRGGRDPVRRLGARRPGARRTRDGAAVAAGLPDRLGQPARCARRLRTAGGGMAAALPYCDALVSGDSLAALEEVVRAIGWPRSERPERAGRRRELRPTGTRARG